MERLWAFHCVERSGNITIHLFRPTKELWELYCERDGYPMTYMFGIQDSMYRDNDGNYTCFAMDHLFKTAWVNVRYYINDYEGGLHYGE